MKKITLFLFLLTINFGIAQDLVMTVSVPPGTTACRLSGPWWSWDPNGGPVGADNGNDTFTFTFSPAPTADMEYLYTINGSGAYENLIDNAQAAECTDRVNNGNMITDYSNYANRIWKVLDGNTVSEIYNNCSMAVLSITKFDNLNFELFPNPTIDSWNIKTNNERISSIKVYDMLGKSVLSFSPNNTEAKIDASTLKSGLYFAKIATDNGSSSLKLIKN